MNEIRIDFRWPWERREERHEYHRMLPIACQAGRSTSAVPFSQAPPEHVESTTVLRRCECGAVDSMIIAGTWTIDQLQGTDVAGEAANKFLASLTPKG